jgi:hypothetical protein
MRITLPGMCFALCTGILCIGIYPALGAKDAATPLEALERHERQLKNQLAEIAATRLRLEMERHREQANARLEELLSAAEEAAEQGDRERAEKLRVAALEVRESLMRKLAMSPAATATRAVPDREDVSQPPVDSRTRASEESWEEAYWGQPESNLPASEESENRHARRDRHVAQHTAQDARVLDRLQTLETFIGLLRRGEARQEPARRAVDRGRAAALRAALQELRHQLDRLERRIDSFEENL